MSFMARLLFYNWAYERRWWHLPASIVSPRCSHVAIEYMGVVYSPMSGGCVVCPIEGAGLPFAFCTFPVEQFARHRLSRGFGVVPSFLGWATHGVIQGANCVTLIAALLRDGGVNVPRSVVTPDRMLDWAWERAVDHGRSDDSTPPATNLEGLGWARRLAEAETLAGTGGVCGEAPPL